MQSFYFNVPDYSTSPRIATSYKDVAKKAKKPDTPTPTEAVTPNHKVLNGLRDLSELELHRRVVQPLLSAMGAIALRYVHGSFERGKDFVYVMKNAYGIPELTVSQVKHEPLTGKARPQESAFNALNQCQQCRRTEVLNPTTHKQERPQRVLFITTYPLPDAALAGARDFLDELSQAATIIGPEVFCDLVHEYLPSVYAGFAYEGGNLPTATLQYISSHREAYAFGLSEEKALVDFFINVGFAHKSGALSSIASGAVTVKDTRIIEFERSIFHSMELLFAIVEPTLKCKPLFVVAADQRSKPQLARYSRGSMLSYSTAKVQLKAFVKSLALYLSGVRSVKDVRKRADDVKEAIEVLAICNRLLDILFKYAEQRVSDDNTVTVAGFNCSISDVDPGALLTLKTDVCITGDAGAGKTCVARMLTQRAIQNGLSCIYFPCSRIEGQETLIGALTKFLIAIEAIESEQELTRILEHVDIIVIDGCDEAANYIVSLGREISDLPFRGPVEITSKSTATGSPWIPDDLRDRVFFEKYKGKPGSLRLSEPIHDCDFLRLVGGNRGTKFEPLFNELWRVVRARPRIILTSRDDAPLNLSQSFQTLSILPFTDEQLSQFFRQWFHKRRKTSDRQRSADDVIAFLDDNPHIKDVCRTPMIATIVAALHENDCELPRSRSDIYDKRFDLLLGRWDTMRGVTRKRILQGRDKWQLLTRLALTLHLQHRRLFDLGDLERVWKTGLHASYPSVTIKALFNELRSVDCVIFPEGGEVFSLGHLSYQEFLCAKRIMWGQRIRTLVSRMSDPWWREVLVFYAGITGDITQLLEVQASRSERLNVDLVNELLREAQYTPESFKALAHDIKAWENEEEFDDWSMDEDSEVE